MPVPQSPRSVEVRRVIDEFLSERQADKLKTLASANEGAGNTPEARENLRRKFVFATWVEDAANRVQEIQAVTHSLKAIHPGAKGTNLLVTPAELPAHGLVGSHCLGAEFKSDVVGNAAALDVYKFLSLVVGGASLLEFMLTGDADVKAALSDDPGQAQAWINSFRSLTLPRGPLSSHTLAKQLYWLTGADPSDDTGYHLLAPLFPTSLAHRVYQTINADRFSEASKSTRQARRNDEWADDVIHDYPNMAVQKLGGTKPQNISQLNSERRGENYLLASLPPRWKTTSLRPLLNTDSMFQTFERRPATKEGAKALRALLQSDPAANAQTRRRREALVSELVGELMVFQAELRTLLSGWSDSPTCRLSVVERRWLDPDAEHSKDAPPADTIAQISQGFGRWLNRQLRDPLPMGDPEYRHWCALAEAELEAEGREACDGQ